MMRSPYSGISWWQRPAHLACYMDLRSFRYECFSRIILNVGYSYRSLFILILFKNKCYYGNRNELSKIVLLPSMNILEIFGEIGFSYWHPIVVNCQHNWNLKVIVEPYCLWPEVKYCCKTLVFHQQEIYSFKENLQPNLKSRCKGLMSQGIVNHHIQNT